LAAELTPIRQDLAPLIAHGLEVPVAEARLDDRSEFETRVLTEKSRKELLERPAGLDAELLDENTASVVVELERLGLPTRAIEGEHQLRTEAFPERMRGNERLELADQLALAAAFEVGVDPILEGGRMESFEPPDLRLGEGLEREVGQRRSAPQGQGLAELPRALLGTEGPGLIEQLLEAKCVDAAALDTEQVAGRLRYDDVWAEQLPELERKFCSDVTAVRGGRSPQS
jgi:hypothetical protein